MRSFTDSFRINGKPMLAPDADVTVSYTDLDADDSGRDESGVMHRIVVRPKVGTWAFEYGCITEDEKRYMERLFGESADFQFSHPDRICDDESITCRAYRSTYGIAWHNAATHTWHNYKFNIIEC